MEISIRKFRYEDIPNKVKWINDPYNNKYLHYELPLKIKNTQQWYLNNQDNEYRYDAVITVNEEPVGIIGLINIDYQRSEGEYYITIGERSFQGKNVAYHASRKLLDYAFNQLKLKKVFLTTEQENLGMQKLAKRLGMLKENLLIDYSERNNQYYNAYYYTMTKEDYGNQIYYPEDFLSEIEYLGEDERENQLYMKRDDLLSFSFGGNKARKARYFFEDILKGRYKTVITYGSKFSNHVRVTANLCKKHNLQCIVVSPYGSENQNLNKVLIELCDAKIIECKVEEVSDTIDKIIEKENENTPDQVYFIPGGGHGNLGTQAYVDAYHEIEVWSRQNQVEFDYIFLASGTGTTQAGLVVGNHLHKNTAKIIGISVAREKEHGSKVIVDSIKEYVLSEKVDIDTEHLKIQFYDDLVESEYGLTDENIDQALIEMYQSHGIALSRSYTGKAYAGMEKYIEKNKLSRKNILFINTGGTPLFFDDLLNMKIEKEL